MIHGDFRAANLMLKRGEEYKVVLIDCNWAGKKRGKYPITRSNGFAHPGKAEGPLVCRMIVVTVPILVNRTLLTSLVA